jgi:D-sedoheptulose 7-phosphate isomerase
MTVAGRVPAGSPATGVSSPPIPSGNQEHQVARPLVTSRRATTVGAVNPTDHSTRYFSAAAELSEAINGEQVDRMARGLAQLRERGGRLFIVGVGGGAGHASHAVNDFRKLAALESYAPSDNVSELTARTNDDGWETSYSEWLKISRLSVDDGLLVFSVGGGSRLRNTSVNLVNAIELARAVGALVYGIVGSPGGTLAELADEAVLIEPPGDLKTPLVESFQAVVWHALVSHPELAAAQGHWEKLDAQSGP